MFGQFEEEHGLAKRAMKIYERATEAVPDADKFEVWFHLRTFCTIHGRLYFNLQMYTIYIAKAAANFGLPATRPIYERAIEVLPDRQTAQMCMRFAQLERKLGEIDRARAIYAHASQFCDPRVLPEFWTEWYNFEIDTGSEDTFREMLRIKRSVQAQFNTEASFLAAQTIAARKGAGAGDLVKDAEEAADPMAQAEKAAGGKGMAFVPATKTAPPKPADDADANDSAQEKQQNEDEIRISDDEEF